MKYYDYNNFRDDTKILLQKLHNTNYDTIVAITRGGLTLAHALSQGLNIRDVQSIQSKHYEDSTKLSSIVISANLIFSEDVKKVLIVDDISDSGDTLSAVTAYLKDSFRDIEFDTCTLFYKRTSIYEPTYWICEANDWIDFFWEADFKIVYRKYK